MNFIALKRGPFVLILLGGAIVQHYYSILGALNADELCWGNFNFTSCQRPISDISTANIINGFIYLFPLRALIYAVILYFDKEARLKFVSILAGFLSIIFGDYYIGSALLIAGILPYLIQTLFEIKESGIKSWHIAAIGGLINFYIPWSMVESGRQCQGGCDMVGLVFIAGAIYFIIAIFALIPVALLMKEEKTKNDLRLIFLFTMAECFIGILYAFSPLSVFGFNATLASGLFYIAAVVLFLRKESTGVPYLNYLYSVLIPLFIFGTVMLSVTSIPNFMTFVSVDKKTSESMNIAGILRVPEGQPIQTIILKNEFILPAKYKLPDITVCLHDSTSTAARGYDVRYYGIIPISNPTINDQVINSRSEIKIFLRGYEGIFYNQQGESDDEIIKKYDELLLFYNAGMNNYKFCNSLTQNDIKNAEKIRLIK
jgi:hypothetical protein